MGGAYQLAGQSAQFLEFHSAAAAAAAVAAATGEVADAEVKFHHSNESLSRRADQLSV